MAESLVTAQQQDLDFTGPFKPSFENFITGDNAALVSRLQSVNTSANDWLYLSGSASCGKTHLLTALMQQGLATSMPVHYFNLAHDETMSLLKAWNVNSTLLLDNIDHQLAQLTSEETLFHLFNSAQQNACMLIVTARQKLVHQTIQLPDLNSRLLKCTHYHLERVPDEHTPELISSYLQRYGVGIDDNVLGYLSARTSCQQDKLIQQLNSLLDMHKKENKLTTATVRKVIASGQ